MFTDSSMNLVVSTAQFLMRMNLVFSGVQIPVKVKDVLLFLKCRAHLIVIQRGGVVGASPPPPPSLKFLPSKFQNGNFITVVMNLVVSRSKNFRENERSIAVFEVQSAPHSQPNFEDFC